MVDINGDGVFDAHDIDVFKAIKDYIGMDYNESWVEKADVNGDGYIDAKDADALDFALQYKEKSVSNDRVFERDGADSGGALEGC